MHDTVDIIRALVGIFEAAEYADGVPVERERELFLDHLSKASGIATATLVEIANGVRSEGKNVEQHILELKPLLNREDSKGLLQKIWQVLLADGKLTSSEAALFKLVREKLGFTPEQALQAVMSDKKV